MRLNESNASLREVSVRLLNPSTGAPVPGKSQANVTIKTAKPGANLVASSATLTEVTGGVSGGGYRLRFTTGEVDTLGELHYEITDASIQPVYDAVTIESPFRALDIDAAAITAAKFAADAIDANALKTDAIDEIKAAVATAVWAGAVSSNRPAGSMGEILQVLAGILRNNVLIDNPTYGTNNLLTAARVRVFANAADCNAATPGAGGDEGAIFKFSISADDALNGGRFNSWKQTRTL